MLAFFSLSFDTATHQAVIAISCEQELPETVLRIVSILIFYSFMRKIACFLISYKNLLRLEGGQFTNSFIDVPGNQLLITSMKLCICFFNKSYPELMSIFAWSKYRLFRFGIYGNSVVNDDINPFKVFEKSKYVNTSHSISMEYWWIYTHRKCGGHCFVDDHVFVVLNSFHTTNEKLISGNDDR